MEQRNKNLTETITKLLIIGGLILIFIGLIYNIPSREIVNSSLKEYYKGDAYNGIVEASIRSGEISSAIISKTIYICSGLIIMSLGLFKIKSVGIDKDTILSTSNCFDKSDIK